MPVIRGHWVLDAVTHFAFVCMSSFGQLLVIVVTWVLAFIMMVACYFAGAAQHSP
jgi:hypothetical protein